MMATWQKYSSLGLLAMALLFVAVDQSQAGRQSVLFAAIDQSQAPPHPLARVVVGQNQAAPPQTQCPTNMVYGCMRTCFSNCVNLNSTTDTCNRGCMMGCDCKDGFVFKSKDSTTCVPASECKVTCPKHMTYNPCTKETRKTCATMNDPPVTLDSCLPRCVCDTGFILSSERFPHCISECS
uniref:TIL domain-containing protein n=1 Tax=Xenopus tropicalis TaxID=8364 RepID=A0A6I8SBD3_XENTR